MLYLLHYATKVFNLSELNIAYCYTKVCIHVLGTQI